MNRIKLPFDPSHALAALSVITVPLFAEVRYRIVDVGTLPPGRTQTHAIGLNDKGQAVGFGYGRGLETVGAFLWTPNATDGPPANRQIKDLGNTTDGNSEYQAKAYGLNSLGQVVGEVEVPWYVSKKAHAFVWQNGRMTDLGTLPGGLNSVARSINNAGKIVGWASTVSTSLNEHPHAFLYEPAARRMRDLGLDNSYGYGINNKDQVVGAYFPGDGSEHAFYWEGATGFEDIHYRVGCGGNTSEALDINENDQIVGYCTDRNRVAFAYFLDRRTGAYIRLNVPGSRAAAINNKGQVVGHFRDSLLIDHAFVWTPATGEMMDLNDVFISDTHWELFYAWDINDAGQIVGQGSHLTDYYNARGFVMTPDNSTPSLTSFSIDPAAIVGGNTAVGTITLSAPAPAGGATVSLSHYYWFVASIPQTVTVPAGSTTYRFNIATAAVWNNMPIEVKATYRGITRATTFTLTSGR